MEDQALELLGKYPGITQVEMAERLAISRSKVQNLTRRLLESDKIERIGGKKYGHWIVKG